MSADSTFDVAVVLVSAGVLAAALAGPLSERIRVPAPALFLLAAAVLAQIFPRLQRLSPELGIQIVTVALIFILFDGGMDIGWRRFRDSAGPIVWIGVVGTLVSAAAIALAAHLLFGFDGRVALLIGAALSPTDPAVVFSVLGGREIEGRTGTILKGESGANDPVGIALMVVLLSAGTGTAAIWAGVGTFALQMLVGAVVGGVGGIGLRWLVGHAPIPDARLRTVTTLVCAPLIFGGAALLHGSGFLAVLFAGIVVGGAGPLAEGRRETEAASAALASFSEIVAFAVLGLGVSLANVIRPSVVWVGVGLAAVMILVVRPVLVGLVMVPIRLRRGEKLFVLFAGLKGAVPILLAMMVVAAGVEGSQRFYDIVFVVVLISVVVQGGLVPTMARWFSVPMSRRSGDRPPGSGPATQQTEGPVSGG
jgi:cell volume regulation protein A